MEEKLLSQERDRWLVRGASENGVQQLHSMAIPMHAPT